MTVQPKSIEEIMKEAGEGEYEEDDTTLRINTDWLRSVLASAIVGAAEECFENLKTVGDLRAALEMHSALVAYAEEITK